MTALALNVIRDVPTWLGRLGEPVRDFFYGLDEALVVAERCESLSRMSDDELAERGLAREDIPRTAFTVEDDA